MRRTSRTNKLNCLVAIAPPELEARWVQYVWREQMTRSILTCGHPRPLSRKHNPRLDRVTGERMCAQHSAEPIVPRGVAQQHRKRSPGSPQRPAPSRTSRLTEASSTIVLVAERARDTKGGGGRKATPGEPQVSISPREKRIQQVGHTPSVLVSWK